MSKYTCLAHCTGSDESHLFSHYRVQVILSLEEAVLRSDEHSLFLQPLFGFMLQIAYDEGDVCS